jgi:hypothetical protein
MGETSLQGIYTMADVATECGVEGVLHMADILVKTGNDVFADAPYTEANEPNAMKGTQDSFLPTPVFRAYNEGVSPVAAHGRPIIEGLALADTYSELDWELYLSMGAKKEEWRSRKDAKVAIAMAQNTIIPEVIYGDIGDDPKGFNGWHTRYKSLTTRPNGDTSEDYNVQSNGGSDSGYMTDIWIIEWDQDECCFTFPQGSNAGIFHEDLGKQTAYTGTFDTAIKQHEVAKSHFTWKMGIFISDDRRVQRITNINTRAAGGYYFDEEKMVDAILQLPSHGENRGAIKIYGNTKIVGQMWKRALSKNNTYFTPQNALDGGGPTLSFNGYPIRICQQILNTLTTIS